MNLRLYFFLFISFFLSQFILAQQKLTRPKPIITNAIVKDTCDKSYINLEVEADNLPLSYLWSNGSTNARLITTVAGSYSVTVTDKKGNSVIGGAYNINAIVHTPFLKSIQSYGSCKTKSPGYIHLETNNNTDIFHWNHNPTLNSGNADNLKLGTYKVTITDAKGICKNPPNSFEIYDYTPNFKYLEVGGVSTCVPDTVKTGYIALDLNKNYPICKTCPHPEVPFISFIDTVSGYLHTYMMGTDSFFTKKSDWDGRIHGLPYAGPLKLTISDHGCAIDTIINIPALDPLSINIFATIPDKETKMYSMFIIPDGGQEPYSFLWNDGSIEQNRRDLLAKKTYKLIVTDGYGCISENKVLVKMNKKNKLHVLPNNSILEIRSEKDILSNYTFQVFDDSGKPYSLNKLRLSKRELHFDISNLAAGVYNLSARKGNEIETYAFVVMK